MTKTEATAEVFLQAFRALPKKERDEVLVRLAQDKRLGRDFLDLIVIADRGNEPSRPFREYLASRKGK
jgi:hypothetical protein